MVEPISSLASLSFTRGVGTDLPTPNPAETKHTGGATFGDVLKDAAMNTVSDIQNAEQMSFKGIAGKVSTREVVDAVMAADRSLQTAIALRDKVVSAYMEITKMPI